MGDAVFTEEILRDLFKSLDTSGDGFLSYGELLDGLNDSDLDWEKLDCDRIWVEADRDGNGRATFGEFYQLVAATRTATEEEMDRAFAFFVQLDKSGGGDGVLDRLEIQEGLKNPNIDWEHLGFDRDTYDKHIFSLADEDGDNRVSFDEFWQLVLRSVSLRYRPAFEANNIHGYKLLGLTCDMLPKLQVRQFDHCRGIMRALRILKGQEPDEAETLKDCMLKGKFSVAKPLAGVRRDLRFGTGRDFDAEERRIQDEYARPQMVVREVV